MFNCRLVDLDLALAYCTLLPQKDVFENLWKLVDKAWQNYDKILVCPERGSLLLLTVKGLGDKVKDFVSRSQL